MLAQYAMAPLCSSVRPSVKNWCSIKTAKYIIISSSSTIIIIIVIILQITFHGVETRCLTPNILIKFQYGTVIMFVYWIDDITRNLQSTSATQGGSRLYTEGLSSVKLLPHTAHSG